MATTVQFSAIAPRFVRSLSKIHRCNRCVVRAEEPKASESPVETSVPTGVDVTKVELDVPAQPQQFSVFTKTQELINGRAAMLGIFAAIGSEIISHQSVVSQFTGKVVDGEMVEFGHGASVLYFAFIVVSLTLASLAPRLFENQQPEDRQFGPFQANAELLNGRVAMMGFFTLVVVEAISGKSPIF